MHVTYWFVSMPCAFESEGKKWSPTCGGHEVLQQLSEFA
jgi:hypothetical protein